MTTIDAKSAATGLQQQPPSPRCFGIQQREWIALLVVVVATMLLRLPYRTEGVVTSDSVNFCVGALTTWVAHPPGYVGFCVLGRALNPLIGNIYTTFVLVNYFATVAAMVLCYVLGRVLGMSPRASLCATIMLSLSVNLLYNSNLALTHNVESMSALAFAACGLIAIRRRVLGRSMGWALAASMVLAVGGSMRPTTLIFLVPLWMYVILRSKPAQRGWIAWLILHALVSLPIIMAWSRANQTLMERAGYGGKSFDLQVMMPTPYEYASLQTDVAHTKAAAPSYHMPWFELLSWVDRRVLHTNLVKHESNWPEPSAVRALKLSAVQGMKMSYFLVLSAPLLVFLPVLIWARWGRLRRIGWTDGIFFFLWIVPATLFYIFGHMGASGYLQVYLGGVFLFLCLWMFGREDDPQRTRDGWLYGVALASAFAGLAFFVVARPTHASSGRGRLADVLLLQYTGPALREGYATSRAAGADGGFQQVSERFRNARSDAELLQAATELHFSPVPQFDQPQQSD